MTARLELADESVACGERLAYTVINTGEVPIMVGAHYVLDRLIDGNWEPIPGPDAFRAWGWRLESGARAELSVLVPGAEPPGRYRLRKPLRADRDPHPEYEWVAAEDPPPIEVIAEFEVTAS